MYQYYQLASSQEGMLYLLLRIHGCNQQITTGPREAPLHILGECNTVEYRNVLYCRTVINNSGLCTFHAVDFNNLSVLSSKINPFVKMYGPLNVNSFLFS